MTATLPRPALVRTALALLACAVLLPAAHAEEYNPFAARLAQAPTDRVIVKLRALPTDRVQAQAGADGAGDRVAALATRSGVALRGWRALTPDLRVLLVAGVDSVGGLERALDRLRADPSVEFAEPDRRMRAHAVPNDPLFANQWYLQAARATASGQTASATNAVAAWDVTTGASSVVIAVLDTGVRFDHPDLRRVANGGKLLDGYDFVGLDSSGQARAANDGDGWDPDPSDPGDWVSQSDIDSGAPFTNCTPDPSSSWHGTRVAGIVAAATNNALGVAGTGYSSRVLPVRVLGKCGGFTSDIIAGMRWAAGLPVSGVPTNPTPAKILNLSLGGDGTCSAAYQSAIDEVVAGNVLVIVSAGNDGSTVDAPANCAGVAAIGALRHVGNKVGFSNLGPGVAISAPGGNCVNVGAGQPCLFSIDTTTNLGATTPGANDYTDQLRFNVGTSFSAPIVAGVAGLMYAFNGALTPAQAVARLRAGARPFPVVAETDPLTNQPIPQCRVPDAATDEQLSQCNCTRRTCGAGITDASETLGRMTQPVAAISPAKTPAPGQTVQLDAGGSSAGRGATIATYAWSVRPGAAGNPAPSATSGRLTSLALPTTGSLSVQLVVTDTNGGTDTVVLPLLAAVPIVTGQTRAAAAAALLAAELEVGGISTQASATVPLNAVISQTPAAGGSVAAGTPVALVLSSGPPSSVTVPDVVGQTQLTATSAINGAGLQVGAVTTESSAAVAAGSVIRQSPAGGTTAPTGSSVALVVSSGSPVTPPPVSRGGRGGGGAFDALTLLLAALLAAAPAWHRRRRLSPSPARPTPNSASVPGSAFVLE
jgi:serine protease